MKFSIIIPVYNKASTIHDALNSIFAQTYHEYEVIVVDDGSTDNVKEVLNAYPGVRVIHQENAGVSAARNTGIRNAGGTYVCFLDADDTWMPNHLEILDRLTNHYPDHNLFITSHIISYSDGRCVKTSDYLKSYEPIFECTNLIGLLNTTNYCIVATNSMCIRKETLEKENIWFVPGTKIGEDTDVWYRVSLKYPAILTKENTTLYRREYSSATQATTYSDSWPFYQREELLLQDQDIPEAIRRSLEDLFDRFRLTGCREAVLCGQGKKARAMLRSVKNKCGKRYWLTYMFCYMPAWMSKVAYKLLMNSKPQ